MLMKIEILEFVEGAQRAEGVTVIIDVFRAFSVACYIFDAGAVKLLIRNTRNIFSKKQQKNRLGRSIFHIKCRLKP
jgi:phosphosulfolactate phosphohydrolase-like enzyme